VCLSNSLPATIARLLMPIFKRFGPQPYLISSILFMPKTLLPILATLVISFGCTESGPPLGQVSGTVTIDGKPASSVDVMFTPVEGGRGSTGTTDTNGQYRLSYNTTLAGALLGSHQVVIRNATPADLNDPDLPMVRTGIVNDEMANIKKTAEVKSGSNTIDLSYP
jgi:hypothetical protein